jgi:hypothetical protein
MKLWNEALKDLRAMLFEFDKILKVNDYSTKRKHGHKKIRLLQKRNPANIMCITMPPNRRATGCPLGFNILF